ncbi:MAG: hypothetical protein ACLR3S_06495 [Clostridium fessum]
MNQFPQYIMPDGKSGIFSLSFRLSRMTEFVWAIPDNPPNAAHAAIAPD